MDYSLIESNSKLMNIIQGKASQYDYPDSSVRQAKLVFAQGLMKLCQCYIYK
ncbi:Hypothetical protein HVR_LOCUS403 [uncultured virus]|nr:Hypothetical protein HVR_LOCUS403 [uncultured virus]